MDIDWLDVAKFAPGWLSFGSLLIIGARKMWIRRYHVAIGPGGDLRAALEIARRAFVDITNEPRRTNWYETEERREIGQHLEDFVGRFRDRKLEAAVKDTADCWRNVFANAPRPTGPMIAYGDGPVISLEDSAEVQPMLQRQVDHAHRGLDSVKIALDRLKVLERRTVGRS